MYNEILPSLLGPLLEGAARLSFTARIDRAHSDRARFASKKDGLAAPFLCFTYKKIACYSHGLIALC